DGRSFLDCNQDPISAPSLVLQKNMNPTLEKQAGIALIVFTILIAFTVILHPAGGNFQHLIEVTSILIVTHSVAILSLPFAAVGFWGLTKRIGPDNFLAISAFSLSVLALIAALLAAATNGLILPFFIRQFKDASPAVVETIKPVLIYTRAVNAAFD